MEPGMELGLNLSRGWSRSRGWSGRRREQAMQENQQDAPAHRNGLGGVHWHTRGQDLLKIWSGAVVKRVKPSCKRSQVSCKNARVKAV